MQLQGLGGQGEALAIATGLSKIGASQSALVVLSTFVLVGAGNAMGRHVVISNDGVWIYLILFVCRADVRSASAD